MQISLNCIRGTLASSLTLNEHTLSELRSRCMYVWIVYFVLSLTQSVRWWCSRQYFQSMSSSERKKRTAKLEVIATFARLLLLMIIKSVDEKDRSTRDVHSCPTGHFEWSSPTHSFIKLLLPFSHSCPTNELSLLLRNRSLSDVLYLSIIKFSTTKTIDFITVPNTSEHSFSEQVAFLLSSRALEKIF